MGQHGMKESIEVKRPAEQSPCVCVGLAWPLPYSKQIWTSSEPDTVGDDYPLPGLPTDPEYERKQENPGLLQHHLSRVWRRWPFKQVKAISWPAGLNLIINYLLIYNLLTFYNFPVHVPLMKRVILLLSIAGHDLQSFSIGTIYSRSRDDLEFGAITYAWKAIHLSMIREDAPQHQSVPSGTQFILQRCRKSSKALMHVPKSHRSQWRLNTHLAPGAGNGGSLQTTHKPSSWSLLYTSHSSTVTEDLSHT